MSEENKQYYYQAEKFNAARSALMLPHPEGEAKSIAYCFQECMHGLHNLNTQELDDFARDKIQALNIIKDTSRLTDPEGIGLFTVKAKTLTTEQKFELSQIVNELASYFTRHCS